MGSQILFNCSDLLFIGIYKSLKTQNIVCNSFSLSCFPFNWKTDFQNSKVIICLIIGRKETLCLFYLLNIKQNYPDSHFKASNKLYQEDERSSKHPSLVPGRYLIAHRRVIIDTVNIHCGV